MRPCFHPTPHLIAIKLNHAHIAHITHLTVSTVHLEAGELQGHPMLKENGPLEPHRKGSTPETPKTATDDDDDDESSSSEIGDAAGRDGLSGVNLHTKGTEFYGNSSNLAFLGNLFARAQNQSEGRDPGGNQDVAAKTTANRPRLSSPENGSTPGKSQLSIVNLLYNADYTGHPSPQSHNSTEGSSHKSPSYANVPKSAAGLINNSQESGGLPALFTQITDGAQMEIEKIFIGSYFTNKHYIHPMLSKGAFMRRCEREAWPISRRAGLFRSTTKFAGLYFAVVALGAINASPNETALLDHFCQQSTDPESAAPTPQFSALDFAKFYFGIAKVALGDLFESSSLETAQALLLLSVFRQNSLQPHSCYMYSGMAVRTAAAIGLASSMSSLPPSRRREAKRTWWCIYSHEVNQIHYGDLDPDAEDNDVAMIPVMVSLAQIMSEASHQLYHSTQRSLSEKSRLAMSLDARLQEWKSNIPAFLNLDAHTLSDPEWAFKQKLVLRLSNICIFVLKQHVWYNTTYALYGSMILLHLILSNFPGLPDEELLEDVEKSLEIFSSMDNIIVARRCAEMLREVLEVARTCLARRKSQTQSQTKLPRYSPLDGNQGSSLVPVSLADGFAGVNMPQISFESASGLLSEQGQGQAQAQGSGLQPEDENFFFSLFSQDQQQSDRTRAEMLANLVDPSILEDFAFGGQEFSLF
ncbi:transcriptional regulator family: Fungal Specific TF [Penicillium pulvis]|uniref:transcriptional regulator family: Fungal Specific TF n=1 Tax=Penicillium pulvis TaxID=1562058 RepID=UPI002547EAEB|nr:transcriptional regulator family: Fungal Specific TF [Penicillium pulvis]KAJ5797572.1 transcriptional regulator family: Fungal Specific TF [Penicillium pulvis]